MAHCRADLYGEFVICILCFTTARKHKFSKFLTKDNYTRWFTLINSTLITQNGIEIENSSRQVFGWKVEKPVVTAIFNDQFF